MDSTSFNYTMEESKATLTTAADTKVSNITESVTTDCSRQGMLSPMAPVFQGQNKAGNDLLSFLTKQEPRTADTAPAAADVDDVMMNFRMNGSDVLYENMEQGAMSNVSNPFMGGIRSDTAASASVNWNDVSSRNDETLDTFNFLIQSLTAANDYVSMLTTDQIHLLRSIRPGLLYEFVQEVAKVRIEKRKRRVLNECAFCKNNGENEECYASHSLKDGRGRVLCPVLRAFRCPRCGATGDRAHTIKYCPLNVDDASERSGFSSRRRMSASSIFFGSQNHLGSSLGATQQTSAATAPPSSPVTASLSHSPLWSNFGI